MRRRDLLFGAGCVAALSGAELLRPRKVISLAGDRDFSAMLPVAFSGWRAEGGGDMVIPKVPGSLADMLYKETVARVYRHDHGGASVMLLAAHGDSQSDLLQLHRPEVCYRAIGFEIIDHRFNPVALPGGIELPSVELTARAGTRIEDIVYWTRLGEYLPVTAGEQRRDRLRTAMDGYVADGVLVRASAVRDGSTASWERVAGFAAALVTAVAASDRAALIGTARAQALAGLRRTG